MVIRVRRVYEGGPVMIGLRRETSELSLFSLSATHQGKAMWGHSDKVADYKPRREPSPETKLTGTLTVDFQPPECGMRGSIFAFSNHPMCGALL